MTDPATTVDALLGGRVRLRQPATGFRTAIDAVLLAAAVDARNGARVAEFGAATGAAALCLAARAPDAAVAGYEIDAGLVALAAQNARENSLADRVEFLTADIAEQPPAAEPFDQVMANPPYREAGTGRPSPSAHKERSVRMAGEGMAQWIASAHASLRDRGALTLIISADRLDKVVALLAGGFGDIRILPLWPREGVAAKRVLLRARKGLRSPSRLLPGLVLHDPAGRYTDAAEAILRRGQPLAFE